MPNMMGAVLTPVIAVVRSSAEKYGGQCVWEFSQIKDPVAGIIGRDKVTKDGICEMLSAKWIECHAQDSSLSAWLANGGQAIDASRIRSLMQLFIIGETMNPGAMVGNADKLLGSDQTRATKRWLEAKGIMQRRSIKPMAFLSGPVNVPNTTTGARGTGSRRNMAQALATDLASSWRNGSGSYRTIGIWGPGGGHAMAAWVAQDVAFFDPNFGEFWFERAQDFIRWFPVFWRRALYEMPIVGLSSRYELMDYSPRATSRR